MRHLFVAAVSLVGLRSLACALFCPILCLRILLVFFLIVSVSSVCSLRIFDPNVLCFYCFCLYVAVVICACAMYNSVSLSVSLLLSVHVLLVVCVSVCCCNLYRACIFILQISFIRSANDTGSSTPYITFVANGPKLAQTLHRKKKIGTTLCARGFLYVCGVVHNMCV